MIANRQNQLPGITAFILASLLAIVSLSSTNKAEGAEKPSTPNIIFILADDTYYIFPPPPEYAEKATIFGHELPMRE